MVVLLATGGYDPAVRLWDASSGMCYRTLQHPDKQVNCLQITPDKQHIAAGSNPSIKLYDANSKNPDPIATFEGHSNNVTALGFQRDGRWMFSGSEDGTLKIWDLRAPTCQRDYESRGAINCVALHPNQGELITGDVTGAVRVWDLTANKFVHEIVPEGETPISAVAIASDASVVIAANFNGAVHYWSPTTSEVYVPLRRVQAHRAYILSAQISPDTRVLATSSSDRTVKLWSTADGSLLHTLAGHSRWVWDCAFSADGTYLVTASSDTQAKLWEVGTTTCVRSYSGHVKAVTAVALNDAAAVPSESSAVAMKSQVATVGSTTGADAPKRRAVA